MAILLILCLGVGSFGCAENRCKKECEDLYSGELEDQCKQLCEDSL